jgi:aspartyl protease family protein
MKVSLVRLFLIAALMLSGVSLLPAVPHQPAQPAAPPAPLADGWNSIAVTRDALGQYRVQASVNGAPIEFLVDTGASHVVLAPADAARAGLRTGELRFSGRASTANGEVALAPVTLREIRIGQFGRRDVPAMVNQVPMSVSLLGMSFLSSLASWEARGDRLMLYW